MAGGLNPNTGDKLELGKTDYAGGPTGLNIGGPTPEELASGWHYGFVVQFYPQYLDTKLEGLTWFRWVSNDRDTQASPPQPDAVLDIPVIKSGDATWGTTMPQSFGTRRIDGTLIWLGDVLRVSDVDPVAKASFAIAFGTTLRPEGENVPIQLSKLWADSVLIYDSEGESTPVIKEGMTFSFYPGDPNAMPDPTIKADMGDETPGFRDLIYVVIKGFPLNSDVSQLPKFRAEIKDADQFAPPEVIEFDTLSPVEIEDQGLVTDLASGLVWGFSGSENPFHFLHRFDISLEQEVSRIEIDGTAVLETDFPENWDRIAPKEWIVHDKINDVVHFQHGANANSMPIATLHLGMAKVISTVGESSTALASTPDNIVRASSSDFARYRAWGATLHAIVLGGYQDEVNIVSYRRQPKQVTPENPVTVDRCGRIDPEDDFYLGLEESYEAADTVLCIMAYPILEQPELISQYQVDKFVTQDLICLFGSGTQLYAVQGGPEASSQNTGGDPDIIWSTRKEPYGVAEFSPRKPRAVFMDPTSGCIMVIAMADAEEDGRLFKFSPIWFKDQYGLSLLRLGMVYSTEIQSINATRLQKAVQISRLDGGSFSYLGSDGHIYVVSLTNGLTNYREAPGVDIDNDMAFDSFFDAIISPHGTGENPRPLARINLRTGLTDQVSIGDFLRWCALKIGYEDIEITVDASVDSMAEGGVIVSEVVARASMNVVCNLYGISAVEIGGTIKFIRKLRGGATELAATLNNDDLAPLVGGGKSEDLSSMKVTSLAASEISSDVTVGYLDPENDYQPNTQTFRRVRFPYQTARSKNVASYEAPLVIDSGSAMDLAGQVVLDGYDKATSYEWRLPHRYINLEPSDIVGVMSSDNRTVEDLIKIEQITYNGDWSLTYQGSRWSLSDTLSINGDTPPSRRVQELRGPSDSVIFAFDIPLIDPRENAPASCQIYTAVGSYGQEWWQSAKINRTFQDTTISIYNTSEDIPWGHVRQVLPACEAAGTTFSTDNDTVIDVTGRSLHSDMLISVSEADFRAGKNKALIGQGSKWELVFFRDVEVVSERHVRISGFLRGRRGTNINCDGHKSGDQFVLIESDGTLTNRRTDNISPALKGLPISYYAVGANVTRHPPSTTFVFSGASNKPWSPTNVKAFLGSTFDKVPAVSSYENLIGTGDRRPLMEVIGQYYVNKNGSVEYVNVPPIDGAPYDPSNLIDGSIENNADVSTNFAEGQSNIVIDFDLSPSGVKWVIDEIKLYQLDNVVNSNLGINLSVTLSFERFLSVNFDVGLTEGVTMQKLAASVDLGISMAATVSTVLEYPSTVGATLWLDPSDKSSMAQSSAGSGLVINDNDPVGRINNKGSVTSFYMAQSTDAARPKYKTDGTYHWLAADGVDDRMISSTAISNIIAAGNFDIFIAFRYKTIGTNDASYANNDPIFIDNNRVVGVSAKSSGPNIQGGIWDGSEKKAEYGITLNTFQVVRFQHTVSSTSITSFEAQVQSHFYDPPPDTSGTWLSRVMPNAWSGTDNGFVAYSDTSVVYDTAGGPFCTPRPKLNTGLMTATAAWVRYVVTTTTTGNVKTTVNKGTPVQTDSALNITTLSGLMNLFSDSTRFADVEFFGMVAKNSQFTDAQADGLWTWLGAKGGLTL